MNRPVRLFLLIVTLLAITWLVLPPVLCALELEEPLKRQLRRLWQAWLEHDCSQRGHVRQASGSYYCGRCRTFQRDWHIADKVRELAEELDARLFEAFVIGLPMHAVTTRWP